MESKIVYPAGWFECNGPCRERILIEGKEAFYKAKDKWLTDSLYCNRCDPEKGFVPVRRFSEVGIVKLEEW